VDDRALYCCLSHSTDPGRLQRAWRAAQLQSGARWTPRDRSASVHARHTRWRAPFTRFNGVGLSASDRKSAQHVDTDVEWHAGLLACFPEERANDVTLSSSPSHPEQAFQAFSPAAFSDSLPRPHPLTSLPAVNTSHCLAPAMRTASHHLLSSYWR
jgi:hypothetical protein